MHTALRHWDPAGVISDPHQGTGPRDHQYDGYALGLLRSIENGGNADRLAHHLARIRSGTIGVGTAASTAKEKELAAFLVSWRESGYLDDQDFGFTRFAF